MKRDYVTAERKAYFYMIDSAIKIGWRWYCDLQGRDTLIPGWAISYGYEFVTFQEAQALELARGYAQKFNIMPDTAIHWDHQRAYKQYMDAIKLGFVTEAAARLLGEAQALEGGNIGVPGASFQGDKG